jgi:hypothetical protein
MVDKVIDPASNTFRVQLALPNPDLSLPAGLRCKAEIGPTPAARHAAAAASPLTTPLGTPAKPASPKPAAAAAVAQVSSTDAPPRGR